MCVRNADVLAPPRRLARCPICRKPIVLVPVPGSPFTAWVYSPGGVLHLCRSIDLFLEELRAERGGHDARD